jgi:hypothetical protein
MGSSLVGGYHDGKHALFVWNPNTNSYEPVTLTGGRIELIGLNPFSLAHRPAGSEM